MIRKLSVRNAKRQARDYLIYFITITVAASLMFGFNSLIYSKAIQSLSGLAALPIAIVSASIFIVFIMAWLTGYMMNFMLKKRSKELSIYMVLGIENKKVVRMFLVENVIIGAVAMLAGYLLGSLIYQALSAIILNLIGRQYVLSFSFSLKGAGLTALYFVFIYLLALIRSNRKIRKMNLRDLLYYNEQNEETIVKSVKSSIVLFACGMVCLAAGLFLYIKSPIAESFDGNGNGIDIVLGTVFFVAFLYLLFVSLPSVLTTMLAQNRKWKYHGSHMILLRTFTAKINNISVTMATLSALFTVSLFLISIGMIFSAVLQQRVALVPFEISIVDKSGVVNLTEYQNYLETTVGIEAQYRYTILTTGNAQYSQHFRLKMSYYNVMMDTDISECDMYMSYSDYAKLREILKLKPVSMDGSSFFVHCLSYVKGDIQDYYNENPVMTVKDTELRFGGIYTEHFDQYDGMANGQIFLFIVPDNIAESLLSCYVKYSAITTSPLQYSQYEELFNQFSSLTPYRTSLGDSESTPDALIVDAKVAIQEANGELYAASIVPLFYLAFILCITAITVLTAHVLSDEKQQQRELVLLRHIGYDRKRINRVIVGKLGLFFIVPAIPPIILNSVMSRIFARGMDATVFVTAGQLWQNIIIAYVIFIVIYFVYYTSAYVIYRRNVI